MILSGKKIGQLALSSGITTDSLFAIEQNGKTFHIPYSGFSGGGGDTYEEVTYDELYFLYTGGTLVPGGYYLITDFQTCYDQPDFDFNGNSITSFTTYHVATIDPILVLATSEDTLSPFAFQPSYPNDKLQYDITWNITEVTESPAKGRITERIDEFNNRTDYDHRTILFKRYRLYTLKDTLLQNGLIDIQSDGSVVGTNTTFTDLSIGDVIYVGCAGVHLEITGIDDNFNMSVSGVSIPSVGSCIFYKAFEETNDDNDYFSYRQFNVKIDDFVEYTTFGDLILNPNSYAKNNYVGNYSNLYNEIGNIFILANNLFLDDDNGGCQNNKIGDVSYNNTLGTDCSNNTIGNYFIGNVSTNNFDTNQIGNNFEGNINTTNFRRNIIGNSFGFNNLFGSNSFNFEQNIIGNYFESNTIYMNFYNNEIENNFSSNSIGDFGNNSYQQNNVNNFYRNRIGNNFNNNTIKNAFQNNEVWTNFQYNLLNGPYYNNRIRTAFQNNNVGSDFSFNNILNAFNNNVINDGFYSNTLGNYCGNNYISNEFGYNTIQNDFDNNVSGTNSLWSWRDLSNISSRQYNTWSDSIGGGGYGNRVNGKELIMKISSTGDYYRIKFTQWTHGGVGGGFQYERTPLDSNGNPTGDTITFTKQNYGNQVDVIIPGVVEITRGNNGGIYNSAVEPSFNSSVSPQDTEWNSVYTEPNNGKNFSYNKIGNNFNSNVIDNYFGFGGLQAQGNIINDNFQSNTIGSFMYNNVIGNYFQNNTIGDYFENNQIQNYFLYNTIENNFESNKIGNYFGNNSFTSNITLGAFLNNVIGDYFGNDLNIAGGTGGNAGGNIINSDFKNNKIGNNFVLNGVNSGFESNEIKDFCYLNFFGVNNKFNTIGNYFVGNYGVYNTPLDEIGNDMRSNKFGNFIGFNVIGANFSYNQIGNRFGNGTLGASNEIGDNFTYNIISDKFGDDGSSTSGGNIIGNSFQENTINTSISSTDFTAGATLVYQPYNCILFKNASGINRLSYTNFADALTITNITT